MPDNKIVEKEDTSVTVDSYLIDFFDTIPNAIKGKNSKITDLLLKSDIDVKDYPNNKVLLHIYMPIDVKESLAAKQKELGFPNFSHFVNANLRKFYEDRHVYQHKVVPKKEKTLKPKVNLVKFNRLVRKCKKKLITGEHTSYDRNVRRCSLSVNDILRKIQSNKDRYGDNYKSANCYSDLRQAVGWNINCDCFEAYMLQYIRRYSRGTWAAKYINNYPDLIGLSEDNFELFADKIIEKEPADSNKNCLTSIDVLEKINDNILEHYDFEVPDVDTYFYLWIYFIYHENEVYKNVDLPFNTDAMHAMKLLEKYTVDNIFNHYSHLNKNLTIENIFDKETINYLKDNDLIDLSELYQINM